MQQSTHAAPDASAGTALKCSKIDEELSEVRSFLYAMRRRGLTFLRRERPTLANAPVSVI
jgi:hypothetical protein